MSAQYLIRGTALVVLACSAPSLMAGQIKTAPEGSSKAFAPNGGSSIYGGSVGLSATKQRVSKTSSAPTPPSQNVRRAAIDRSLKNIWRQTPYEIVDVRYPGEKLRKIGETGMHYEANVSITLRFPTGWLANCIGPSAAWGCRYIDSNMMQTSSAPIAVGETRTYTGRMTMARMWADGEWESRGGKWQKAEPAWESRVYWDQR